MNDTNNMTLPNLADYYDPKLPDSALAAVPNGLLREQLAHPTAPQPTPDTAKPVAAWQWRSRDPYTGSRWSQYSNIKGTIEAFRNLWKDNMVGNPAKVAIELRPLYATPPVRGDREAIARCIFKQRLKVGDQTADVYFARRENHPHAIDDSTMAVDAAFRDADALIAAGLALPVQPGAGEGEAALAKRCYTMSEPHLSGYRLIIGFNTLEDVQDAQAAIGSLPK